MYVSNEREKAICRKVSQGLMSEIVGSKYSTFNWEVAQRRSAPAQLKNRDKISVPPLNRRLIIRYGFRAGTKGQSGK